MSRRRSRPKPHSSTEKVSPRVSRWVLERKTSRAERTSSDHSENVDIRTLEENIGEFYGHGQSHVRTLHTHYAALTASPDTLPTHQRALFISYTTLLYM